MKEFAPDFPRNDSGWVVFPQERGGVERKKYFPQRVMKHYAKMHLDIARELVKYVSEEGETIMDIMAGTGTMIYAATMGRRVICVEIEDGYHKMQHEVLELMRDDCPDIGSRVTLLHGNCKHFLPIPCNHIIFSPPYAGALKPSKSMAKIVAEKYYLDEEDYHEYAKTAGNVGLLNTFLYNQEMEKIYKLCYQSIKPNGTLSIVIKDIIRNGARVNLGLRAMKVCVKTGFELKDWFKREAMGGAWQDIARTKGKGTVDDEDIIILRKA